MSAGKFARAFYEADSGDVHPLRPQPETLAAQFDTTANAAPAGPATNNNFVQINKPRRAFGIGARFVTAEWASAPPAGYAEGGVIKIAVPTKAIFDAITIFSAGTYLGQAITIITKIPEQVR